MMNEAQIFTDVVATTAPSSSGSSTTKDVIEPLAQYYLASGYTNLEAAIIVPKITGSLSIVGSTYIIQDVLRNPIKRSSIYHRIMVGLSSFDLILSFMTHFLTSWPMPKGYYLYAMGDVRSCDFVATFASIGHFGMPLYHCSLITYYMLELKFSWPTPRIREAEKWLHAVPIFTGIMFALLGLLSQSFGPVLSACGVTPSYPYECHEPNSNVECIRGADQRIVTFLIISYLLLNMFTLIYISVGMAIIYKHIRKLENKLVQISFTSSSSIFSSSFKGRKTSKSKRLSRKKRKLRQKMQNQSRRIMFQGFLYSGVLLNTLMFPMMTYSYFAIKGAPSAILDRFLTIFFPLQGFFNCWIYLIPVFRKRWIEWKSKRNNQRSEKNQQQLQSQRQLTEERRDKKGSKESFKSKRRRSSLDSTRSSITRISQRFLLRRLSVNFKWWEQELDIIPTLAHRACCPETDNFHPGKCEEQAVDAEQNQPQGGFEAKFQENQNEYKYENAQNEYICDSEKEGTSALHEKEEENQNVSAFISPKSRSSSIHEILEKCALKEYDDDEMMTGRMESEIDEGKELQVSVSTLHYCNRSSLFFNENDTEYQGNKCGDDDDGNLTNGTDYNNEDIGIYPGDFAT